MSNLDFNPEWVTKVFRTLEHNLRSPIGMVKTGSELLAFENDREEYRRLRAQATAALDLLDTILFDYRVTHQCWGTVTTCLQWSDVLSALRDEIRVLSTNYEVPVHLKLTGLQKSETDELELDLSQLLQAFRCLLRFALSQSSGREQTVGVIGDGVGIQLVLTLDPSNTWLAEGAIETEEFSSANVAPSLALLQALGHSSKVEPRNVLAISIKFNDNSV
jgi:hypothetical protein